ncbi:MAG: exodeoxyribonuclease V subunit alpha [Desulfofustis sp.]|nr:exodeoxyribonuclease V subunit alpha [Desulfofustis sp.]
MTDDSRDSALAPVSRFMAAAFGRHSGLEGKGVDELRTLVAALTTALLEGHICIELSERQRQLAARSLLTAVGSRAPLVLSGTRLYFGRYFGYESELSEMLVNLAAADDSSADREFKEKSRATMDMDPHQQRAVNLALTKKFCIISGGPGTGKTTLIISIISQLLDRHGTDLRIALAAPTGKAALRMQESIKTQLHELTLEPALAARFPAQATTLHRLLGLGRRPGRTTSQRSDPLVHDVVVVDEASMVDLAMMWRLSHALKKDARLILLGDRDQLASVESGAVLADCIDSLPNNVARLKKSYRFNRSIARLAEKIKTGAADEAWKSVTGSDNSAVAVAPADWLNACIAEYRHFLSLAEETADPIHYDAVFKRFKRFRVLCALRKGPSGAEEINLRIEQALKTMKIRTDAEGWYSGKPVLITSNDYDLDLFNGDIGICLPDSASDGVLRLWFEGSDGSFKKILPSQVPLHEPGWALTIHKSQGSEFEEVVVVLPEIDNRVLCRELLYTAVTRARARLSLVAQEDIFKSSVEKKTLRHSGLADRLAG